MGLFTKEDLSVLDLIVTGKRLSDEEKELLPALRTKLGVASLRTSDLLDRFSLLTGWANRPKDYPV